MSQNSGYPITYTVPMPAGERNRLTSGFRIILAIPHLLLVGSPGGVGWSAGSGSAGGVIGAAAAVVAIISWFAIVFTGSQPQGLWNFTYFYMKWRSEAVAYIALLRDEYPPFGEGAYPTTFGASEAPVVRDRLSVGFRLILVIPHLIVLVFVGIAWMFTAVFGWFAILITGTYPEGLFRFAVGYLRWSLRVEAYLLLMRDEYPPFSFD